MSKSKFKIGLAAYARAWVISMLVYLVMTAFFWPEAAPLSATAWWQELVPLVITVGLGDYFYRRAVSRMK